MATTPGRTGPQLVHTAQPLPSIQSPASIKQANFDLAISLILFSWPALSSAVTNSWGGPDSSGKRDWFAGAVSDLFISRPDTDEEELECVLLQVMEDEFDVRLEDESEVQVAADVCQFRRTIERGDFTGVERLRERWASRQGKGQVMQEREVDEEDMESGSESESDEDDGGVDVDQEMIDAEPPRLVPVKEKIEPVVDDDGFTKVVSRKKR